MAEDRTAAPTCDGSRYCEAEKHLHGCFADRGNCERPEEHSVVLGYCPHGVNLDREFCPEGCRV